MKLDLDLLYDGDQSQIDSMESNNPSPSANLRLLFDNLPSVEHPPETLPFKYGENLVLQNLDELSQWDNWHSTGEILPSVHSVGRSILTVEGRVIKELLSGAENPIVSSSEYRTRLSTVAEKVFQSISYSEKSGLTEAEWKALNKSKESSLALFKSISHARAAFNGSEEAKIGGNFHDRVSVLVCIMSASMDSIETLKRWGETGNFQAGHDIVVRKSLMCKKVVEKLNITEAERTGFLAYIDKMCLH